MSLAATHNTAWLEHVMGMPIIVDVRDDGFDQTAVADAFAWFRHVDAIFSTYEPTSAISRLGRGELALHDAPEDVRIVLGLCEEARVATKGYFDVRANQAKPLDPSGLVKGWSVDRGAEILERAGATNYAVYAGGDIRVSGGALPREDWRIGIEHPGDRRSVATTIVSRSAAIATSGAYIRGDHVRNPHTGKAPAGVLSVTIVGASLATADAYATAAFAMGEEGAQWAAGLDGFEALTLLADGRALATPGFPFAPSELDSRSL